ncbi:MAG: hypothetical protein AB8B93_06135 [Pseudomonadales bacterium]
MAVTASQAGRDVDWYVITDEADLTLRIANGLRVGEDRWGELTLNHPVAAHRWLEFTIEEDGQLSCRPSRRDVVIEVDGEPQEQIILQSGDPIELPHNRVHISDSFKRGPSDAPPAVVRCIEVDAEADAPAPTMAQMVITESDLEPTDTTSETVLIAAPEQPSAPVRRPNTMADMMADKMADKMADRIAAHTSTTVRAARTNDSIETALIPVDAESPFAANEVSDILRRPIEIAEQQDTRGAANSPVITPALTQTAAAERRSYTYLWALSAILGLGILAAIITAVNSAPDAPQRPGNLGKPGAAIAAEAPTRTEELLTSVQNILSRSGAEDPAAWEFAVRSYEYILAQEPDNDLVRRRLNAARSRVAALRANNAGTTTGSTTSSAPPIATPAQATPQTPAQPTTSGPAAPAARPFVLNTEVSPAIPAATQTAGEAALAGSEAALNGAVTLPIAATANIEPLTQEQIANRLRLASARLADGQIVAPRGSSASALILSVLAVEPDNREAINLLNASAEVMVTRAEQSYANNNAFGARNTLEEVLAFHPRHGRANERWLEWTGSPSRYR